jgi:hypothetical protein
MLDDHGSHAPVSHAGNVDIRLCVWPFRRRTGVSVRVGEVSLTSGHGERRAAECLALAQLAAASGRSAFPTRIRCRARRRISRQHRELAVTL